MNLKCFQANKSVFSRDQIIDIGLNEEIKSFDYEDNNFLKYRSDLSLKIEFNQKGLELLNQDRFCK